MAEESMRARRANALASSLLLAASACATASASAHAAPRRSLPSAVDVLVMIPAIRSQRVQDEMEVPLPKGGREAIEAKLMAAARRAVGESGLTLAVLPEDTETVSALSALQASEARLARGLGGETVFAAMRRITAARPDAAVLAHALEAAVGPGGTWNPGTGAITSSMSRTVLRAALVRCSTGEVLWANQVQFHDLPAAEEAGFQEALVTLYASFPRKAVNTP